MGTDTFKDHLLALLSPDEGVDPSALEYTGPRDAQTDLILGKIGALLASQKQRDSQLQDVLRVCNALAAGDLTHKFTVLLSDDGDDMILQLKKTLATIVSNVGHFAAEITRVSQDVGIHGRLGAAAQVDSSGVWHELTDEVNGLVGNLTTQFRSIAAVTGAVSHGDLTRKIDVPDAQGELRDVQDSVNGMVDVLATLTRDLSRIALDAGTHGILAGAATVESAEGVWNELSDNVSSMVATMTNEIRAIAQVVVAVARGDLTKKMGIDARGEMLDLKCSLNAMVDQLGGLVSDINGITFGIGADGMLGGRARVQDAHGEWATLMENLNKMAANYTYQVRTTSMIAHAVTMGDFTRRLELDLHGEPLDMQITVNDMVSRLERFVSEVSGIFAEIGVDDGLQGGHGTWEAVTRNLKALVNTARGRRVSDLWAGLGNEIRAPMNGILGMTEMVLDTELDRTQRESLLIVHSLARSLLVILDDVLDLARLEAGRMTIEAIPYSLRQIVFDTLQSLVGRATGVGIDLVLNVDPDVPDAVIGDSYRLRQVMTNLVQYAFKSTREGSVRLDVTLVGTQSSADDDVELQFCVKDTGLGLAQENLDRVFDTMDGANDLGLYIAKRLVLLMQGAIWAESELGKGSKFSFTVKVRIQSPESAEEARMKSSVLSPRASILFVDTLRDTTGVKERLAEMGFLCVLVNDVSQVAVKERCHRVDAIVVDSISVAESVRQHEHLRCIPMIILATTLNMRQCLEYGMIGFSATPTPPLALSSVLLPVLERSAANPMASVAPVPPLEILLAEDNLVNQKLAKKILEKYGHTVEVVENGRMAVQAFTGRAVQDRRFDVILMDVMMPEMDGVEAAQRIREYEMTHSLRPTPIIALEVQSQIGGRERCLEAGMNDSITKPLRRVELFKAIRTQVEKPGSGLQARL